MNHQEINRNNIVLAMLIALSVCIPLQALLLTTNSSNPYKILNYMEFKKYTLVANYLFNGIVCIISYFLFKSNNEYFKSYFELLIVSIMLTIVNILESKFTLSLNAFFSKENVLCFLIYMAAFVSFKILIKNNKQHNKVNVDPFVSILIFTTFVTVLGVPGHYLTGHFSILKNSPHIIESISGVIKLALPGIAISILAIYLICHKIQLLKTEKAINIMLCICIYFIINNSFSFSSFLNGQYYEKIFRGAQKPVFGDYFIFKHYVYNGEILLALGGLTLLVIIILTTKLKLKLNSK